MIPAPISQPNATSEFSGSGIQDIRLFDQALPSDLFARLVRAVKEIGDERIKRNYKTTFWFPRNREPSNLAEEAILQLIPLAKPGSNYIGTEWWLGRCRVNEKVPFHFDRDLSLSKKTGVYIPPLYASILYLNWVPSSPTVILGQIAGPDGKTRIPENPDFRQPVAAVPNRYVVFPGTLRHGVIPEQSGDEDFRGQATANIASMRLSLLVNYWHRRPDPPICTDYKGKVYASLQQCTTVTRPLD